MGGVSLTDASGSFRNTKLSEQLISVSGQEHQQSGVLAGTQRHKTSLAHLEVLMVSVLSLQSRWLHLAPERAREKAQSEGELITLDKLLSR